METLQLKSKTRAGVLVAAGLAIIWLVAAALRPTATYHLAPILIACAAPVLATGGSASRRSIVAITLAGAAIATAAGILLAVSDSLRGPTLLPYGGAFAEAITFILVGSAVGLMIGLNSAAN